MARKLKKAESRFPAEESVSEENNGVAVEEQAELDNMPPSSPLGKAARAYIKIHCEMKDAVVNLKDRKGKAQDVLVAELEEAKRDSITVDGYTLKRNHIEEEKISVKAPKVND